MTKIMNFKTMISHLTTVLSADRSRDRENLRNLMNGGFAYTMRARTFQ
ncbi:MAG: hypothetical protein IJU77_09390 [Butyrivibrio sp.]|nr:hypothetical protein [Butyrivibrio sp.]